jgi:uncharacterized protein YdiU (UPF0061 family)
MMWNLARLAEALLPLIAEDEGEAVRLAEESLERFASSFDEAYAAVMRRKLGLARDDEREGDRVLASDLLERMAANRVDYTLFFRRLCASAESADADAQTAALFANEGAFHAWAELWRERLAREDVAPSVRAAAMRRENPMFIARNHRVEQMIAAAVEHGDFAPFETLLDVVTRPYDERPELARFADPPSEDERVLATFCGT